MENKEAIMHWRSVFIIDNKAKATTIEPDWTEVCPFQVGELLFDSASTYLPQKLCQEDNILLIEAFWSGLSQALDSRSFWFKIFCIEITMSRCWLWRRMLGEMFETQPQKLDKSSYLAGCSQLDNKFPQTRYPSRSLFFAIINSL